ncbi:MAG TPA: hypothetical protein VKK79_16875 [Candidatus Lokiarchaeia archaeon]|nr:hypothetical protein [Candidatus Lokiarchaeia archaeon]
MIGIVVYKFELNRAASGDIEPDFRRIASEFTQDYKGMNLTELISSNDLYGIFFNQTSGLLFKGQGQEQVRDSFLVSRLKETPYKIISYYCQAEDQTQYLVVCFFKLDEDSDHFEGIIRQMATKLGDEVFQKLATGNPTDIDFATSMQQKMESYLQFYIFQIGRASNFDKLQKVALIYATPERLYVLERLRSGPVSRIDLAHDLEKMNEKAVLDVILRPMIELNLVRRDWAKGYYDHQTGVVRGEGEYVFLIKDVALVRKPPFGALNDAKKNSALYPVYRDAVNQFFSQYDPFANVNEESKTLAKFLLDPEVYDFLAMLKNKSYVKEKVASIIADFTDPEKILQALQEVEIVGFLRGEGGSTEWISLLGEIVPIVVFPEYLITKIQDRVAFSGAKFTENLGESPLTPEVARRALDLLETTYNEKIEF